MAVGSGIHLRLRLGGEIDGLVVYFKSSWMPCLVRRVMALWVISSLMFGMYLGPLRAMSLRSLSEACSR